MTETNRIEFKQKLTDELEKETIAFLNYHEGGVIYVGINKIGEIVGVADVDGDMLKIKDRLKNNIEPSCMGLFDVVYEAMQGKGIIKITIASGSEKPYYIKKQGMSERGCFIRIGTSAEPMPIKMIEALFAKRTRNSIGKIKSNKQDLKFEQLKIYYDETGSKLNSKFATNLELQTEAGDYNYAAYLMADTNSTSIKVAKYKGATRTDLVESNEYGYCSIVKATKQVLDKIDLENKTITKITSKERANQRLWDAIALREAIINAFVHNDYTKEVPPKFELFDDRIEITSAGGLPEGLSKDEFFEGFSVPRNKEIMRIYKDLNLVEHLGSGVPRILESYPKECFKFSENFLRMTFPSAIPLSNLVADVSGSTLEKFAEVKKQFGSVSDRLRLSKAKNIAFLQSNYGVITEEIRNNYGRNTEEIRKKFGNNAVNTILLFIMEPTITTKDIATILGISPSTIEKAIAKLKDENIITREGATKAGYWKIIVK